MPRWVESIVFEEGRTGHIVAIALTQMPAKIEDFRRLEKLPRLRRLNMVDAQITGSDCQEICRFQALEHITLSANRWLTDEGVACLADLENLKVLELHNTSCTWRASWHFRNHPSAELKLADWMFSRLNLLPGELQKLTECREAVKGVNLLFADDGSVAELVDSLPELSEIVMMVQPGKISRKSIDRLMELSSWRTVSFLFPGSEDHHLANDFGRYEDGGGTIDFELIREMTKTLGPRASQVQLYDHDGIFRLSFRCSPGQAPPQMINMILPTSELDVAFVESLEGLDKVPRLHYLGTPIPASLAIAKRMPAAKHLTFAPYRSIGDAACCFDSLSELESLVFVTPAHTFDQRIPDSFFERLNCRATLKSLKMSPTMELSAKQREDLQEFPLLSISLSEG